MFPVSTLSIKAADIKFRMFDEYNNYKALFADITNRLIKKRGYNIDLITAVEGADRLKNILDDYNAVFYEYFMTDIYGHKRKSEDMKLIKTELNLFLKTVLEKIDNNTSVIIISDHGNAEDFSTGNHTLNKVPFIFYSNDSEMLEKAVECRQLTDIYYFVLDYF